MNLKDLKLPPLYPISANKAERNHLRFAQDFIAAGARFFQVREKRMADGPLLSMLLEIQTACRKSGARFLVNDRVDLALAAKADGVHLGQTDLPVRVARQLLGPEKIVGISTHTREQFEVAQNLDVDYVAIGPIFSTQTKPDHPYRPLGLKRLREILKDSRLPVVAIGGINLHRASAVWEAGADSVAVISDILDHVNPQQRVRQYLELASHESQ